MSICLTDLAGKPKTIEIPVEGSPEPLSISYRPNMVTPETEAIMLGWSKKTPPTSEVLALLSGIVVEWNIEDIPCSQAGFMKVPLPYIVQIMERVFGDASPKATPETA